MNPNPECPVCSEQTWETLGSRLYQKSDASKLSSYIKMRYEVLFNIWFPGKESVRLSSMVCSNCGFITFMPRPTTEDIDRKYTYLYSLEAVKSEAESHLTGDNIRATELYSFTVKYLRKNNSQVLDFGGGNGRLLSCFLSAGHTCSVVDYVSNLLPGILHIGNAVDDIPENKKFDLIICSHVLEHVAEPKEILMKLSRHLAEDGVLYAEVPLEIWNNIPLPIEPVTHINFFSQPSLKALMAFSGMYVLKCVESRFSAPQGERGFAIKAIARLPKKGETNNTNVNENAVTVKQLIAPTYLQKMKRLICYPDYAYQEIKGWGKANIPFFWRFIP